MKVYKGQLVGTTLRVAAVVSRFNEFISTKLLDGALDCLVRHNVKDESIDTFWVPGAFEVPMVANKIMKKEQYDAIICLGAVIRGETPHFDYIAAEVSKGIAQTAIESGAPIIFGIITADTVEQAIERAGTKAGNKGWTAALAAIEMANLYKEI